MLEYIGHLWYGSGFTVIIFSCNRTYIAITDGSDYIGATQTYVINSGERRCITIEILDDSDVESQEYLLVQLTAQSFPVTYRYCYIYITDNDSKCSFCIT